MGRKLKAIRQLYFLIPPKVHLLDINGPAHIFYEAIEYGADLQQHFLSINQDTRLQSSAGLFFSDLQPFDQVELNADDYLFIPGLEFDVLSDPSFLAESRYFFQWLVAQHRRGANICSICTGSHLLAEAGLLNGKSATTHWKYFRQFSERYPAVSLKRNRLFVLEDRIFTSAGVSAGIDLSLFIVEQLCGAKFATDIAKEVVIYFRRSEEDPQLSVFLQYRNHLDDRIHQAQDMLSQQLHKNLTIDELANSVNMSPRNLTRLFKKTTGITIGAYVDRLRVEKAVQLIGEDNKVDFVASECGLKSTNQLRSLLKKYRGQLPSEIIK